MCEVMVILILGLMLFLVWASADIGSNIYLKALCRGDKRSKVVSLTFDDGPDEYMTPIVLDVLKKYQVKATFFLVGTKVEKHPEIVRRMVEEGHRLANHTYSHKGDFPLSCFTDVTKEILRCNESIYRAANVRPVWFRPPFGVTNPIIGKAIRRLGFQTIGWSIRSFDTVAGRSREKVGCRIIDQLHPGAVVLLHDRCEKADELLEKVIVETLKRGYEFISLDEMFNIDGYGD